ncbi:class I SAM-dependent DNA methyltransferase [Aquisalinus flavus]|uniref:Methyltransferase type 11 domain-containing protein n=1 Tax=Aquisalinus flavus TaxID=1526572 RepID=A0A8J2Y8A2_9PROT|nr:class I SAM-dependent methyltransferase [Aquisalinus flavus]MBD0425292.1 methyltransferase domain-containing protein [Aquisalinus flavus]UNE49055.1 methyltransferase domain-containing protein [Aquisalinus flavus]GGD17212.1 hypothetical protein GCM10011342_27520 [Aquisalinus flavus]
MLKRHRIQFPPENSTRLAQSEVIFHLVENDKRHQLRFHDYDELYKRPGLYEQVFYERLQCNSPVKVAEILEDTLTANAEDMFGLRVLDLGAGNGIMGEELKKHGVSRLVGADIIPEARDAAWRDRPSVYDDYVVADFSDLTGAQREELESWRFNALTVVAALGFADIPVEAFVPAMNLVEDRGWVAFNIKETFLQESDDSGFSSFIRKLIFSEYLEVHHLERYRHRLSMEGEPLYYYAMVARKMKDVPDSLD